MDVVIRRTLRFFIPQCQLLLTLQSESTIVDGMEHGNKTAIDSEDRGGPLARLRRLTAGQRELAREQTAQVRRARADGYSWQAIASALEISKQAAHKKYGRN